MASAETSVDTVEGWNGNEYVVLFGESDISLMSKRYRIQEFLPDHVVVGISGWDDLIIRATCGATYRVPCVPLITEYVEPYVVPTDASKLEQDERFTGKIKWYINPIVFGGSPDSDENMVWLNHEQHAEVVVWWNRKYEEITD